MRYIYVRAILAFARLRLGNAPAPKSRLCVRKGHCGTYAAETAYSSIRCAQDCLLLIKLLY